MTKEQYRVYRSIKTNLPSLIFETLYVGFDKEKAYKIYNEYKFDPTVYIKTDLITINPLKL